MVDSTLAEGNPVCLRRERGAQPDGPSVCRETWAKGFERRHCSFQPCQPAVVVEAMKERGIDLSRRSPRVLTADTISHARLVVTMGCSVEEACPKPMLAAMQKKLVDWHLADPKGRSIEEVRRIRDEIEKRVREVAQESSASGSSRIRLSA
jgi:Low molecular weight phosphotyrosine protein phosphatase